MHTIQLTIPDKAGQPLERTYQGAENWGELRQDQYWAICKVLLLIRDHDYLRMTLPTILYGIPFESANYLFNADQLIEAGWPDEQVADALDYGVQLLATCDWVFDSLPSNWPLTTMVVDKSTVYGPGDGLRYLTFEEFMYAEKCWSKFHAKPDNRELAKLGAILLRQASPKPKGEDKRRLFEPGFVERDAKRFLKLDRYQLWGILLAYNGARTSLTDTFKNVFWPAAAGKKGGSGGWYDVALSMADTDVQKFEANNRANVYLVLAMLDKAIAQAEALK